MLQLFCHRCKARLTVHKKGIHLIETGADGPRAIWQAKILACPQCGLKIVQRDHGQRAVAYDFEKTFPETLAKIQAKEEGEIVYVPQ